MLVFCQCFSSLGGVFFLLLLFSASLVAQMVKRLPVVWETWVQSLGQEDPLEQEMATHSVFLPGKSYGQRSLVGYSPWDRKRIGHD